MVEVYNDSHFEMIKDWYHKRGVNFIDRSVLPVTGFIVPGKAAGFVYATDSSICFIEGYVTNPLASTREASDALDLITQSLIDWARSNGYKYMKCETTFNSIKNKAKRFGFKILGKSFSLTKEL